MFEETDPKTLMRWLTLGAVAYFLLPFDLIPDFLGIPGRIDDVVTVALLAWLYQNHRRRYTANPSGRDEARDSASGGSGQAPPAPSRHANAFDAYEVLQIKRSATPDAIRAAYRARMQEYHPDKVAHLGEALQKLALEKSQEIQRAYRELHK